MFDKNGDNEVSVEEIKSMFDQVKGGSGIDEKMIMRAVSEVDRKGKQSLKFNEFKAVIERLFQN